MTSSASLQSGSSLTSNSEKAHEITVTTSASDDPRFVIWGLKQVPGRRKSQQSIGTLATPELAQSSSLDNACDVSGQFVGSNRWSSSKRRSIRTNVSPVTTTTPSPTPAIERVLMAATTERWIAEMTSKIESDLMTDFFLTYRSFLSPLSLCKLLITRFEWALLGGEAPEDTAGRRIVRVRTYVVIRHWLLNYFREDFVPSRDLRMILTDWLNGMGKDARLQANPTDLRLIKSLKKVVKKLKAAYATFGPDQAVSANRLIAEYERESQERRRASTSASNLSLPSVQEERSQASDSKGKISAETRATLSGPEPGNLGNISKAFRTSSSEDDVDLNIEIQASGYDSDERPVIPPVIPISPLRVRQANKRNSRSPRLAERSSNSLPSLPIMPEHNRISRYLTSTVGSIAKLKRIMKSKDASQGSHSINSLTSNVNMENNSADLLRSKKDLDTYLKRCGIESQEETLPRLGIFGITVEAQLQETGASALLPEAPSESPGLRHVSSVQTIKSQTSQQGYGFRQQERNVLQPAFVEQTLHHERVEAEETSVIQLDDYDSSDDESANEGNANGPKTLRRLPAARDLRTAGLTSWAQDAKSSIRHRHSIDTISSYGTRRVPSIAVEAFHNASFATYDSGASSANDEDPNTEVAQGVIPFFVPPIDSDDEEPGDVEAALKRLEGQVDHAKQRLNAEKVEEYLKLSEKAKANGYLDEAVEDSEDDQAEDPKQESSARQSHLQRADHSNMILQEAQSAGGTHEAMVVPPFANAVDTNSVQPGDDAHTHGERTQASKIRFPTTTEDSQRSTTVSRRIQRKSSVRRLFSTSRSSSTVALTLSSVQSFVSLHHSFLLDYKTDLVSRHFCIIERDLLEKVTWQELVSGDWRERDNLGEVVDWQVYLKQRARINADHQAQSTSVSPVGSTKKAGDVQVIIQRFNLMCNWIASESKYKLTSEEMRISLSGVSTSRAHHSNSGTSSAHCEDHSPRIRKLTRWPFKGWSSNLHPGPQKCYRMYNFQSMTQLIHGLQSPWIDRLKKTWKRVPAFEMRLFAQLKLFCSHLRNFRLLREATNMLAQQWGPPGQEAGSAGVELAGVPGAIPFFGMS